MLLTLLAPPSSVAVGNTSLAETAIVSSATVTGRVAALQSTLDNADVAGAAATQKGPDASVSATLGSVTTSGAATVEPGLTATTVLALEPVTLIAASSCLDPPTGNSSRTLSPVMLASVVRINNVRVLSGAVLFASATVETSPLNAVKPLKLTYEASGNYGIEILSDTEYAVTVGKAFLVEVG